MAKSAGHLCKGAEVFTQKTLQTLIILNPSTLVRPGNGKLTSKIPHFFFLEHLTICV